MDRPIIFSAPMVRALLDGRKTQTRRVLKPQSDARSERIEVSDGQWSGIGPSSTGGTAQWDPWRRLPYAVGDRLWVREAWRTSADRDAIRPRALPSDTPLLFECDDAARSNSLGLWGRRRRSFYMPRWASRLTLTVTDVRVQRLQEISADDAQAEGISIGGPDVAVYRDNASRLPEAKRRWDNYRLGQFRGLWNSIHGPAAWDANPWCCAISFDVRKGNIDAA